MEYQGKQITAPERNRIIKQYLKQKYPTKDVSVEGDTGTAYGWVTIEITVDRPKECVTDHGGSPFTNMDECRICWDFARDAEREIAVGMDGKEIPFYSYTADDGYNSQHKERHINVRFRESEDHADRVNAFAELITRK